MSKVRFHRFRYYTLNKQGPATMIGRRSDQTENSNISPIKCYFPDLAAEMGALYLTKEKQKEIPFEHRLAKTLEQNANPDPDKSETKVDNNEKDEENKRQNPEKTTQKTQEGIALYSLFHPKNQDATAMKRDNITAVILASLVAVFAFLAALGTQNALTYTFEKIMPSVRYRWVYLYLLMFLEISLLIFFAVFCCT